MNEIQKGMKNILVTGSSGQLGHEIRGLAYTHKYKIHKYFHTGRKNLDITDRDKVKLFVDSNSIDCIINCAAYTNVDKAESEPDMATMVNASAVEGLVHEAAKYKIPVIHVSSDYVFDGANYIPYREDDIANPVSAYGRSKLQGENHVLQYELGTIVRTSWLYSSRGKNFFNTILKLGEEKDEIKVVYDQIGTPTYARDVAIVLLDIATIATGGNNRFAGKIYHYSNEGVCSWYDFAIEILRLTGRNCRIIPVETPEYPTLAKRPYYSVLNKSKIKNELSMTIPHWRSSLQNCIDKLG